MTQRIKNEWLCKINGIRRRQHFYDVLGERWFLDYSFEFSCFKKSKS